MRFDFITLSAVFLFTLGSCANVDKETAENDGDSRFLRACDDKECGSGLSCICGVCTSVCTSDEPCQIHMSNAICISQEALKSSGHCQLSGPPWQSVCDVVCQDDSHCSGLGGDFICRNSFCREPEPTKYSASDSASDLTDSGVSDALADLDSMIWDSSVGFDSQVLGSSVDSGSIVSDSSFTEASTDSSADVGDADPKPNCEFTGEPRIEPADAEISTTQRFTLEGISQIPPECLQWRISPSSFRVYGSSDWISVDFDRDTGEFRTLSRINNTAFEIAAFIADEWVATTSVHFFDKDQPITGVFREVAVLGCPGYSEIPREMIDEIIIDMGPSIRELVMEVTFVPFESYVDYRAVVNWIPDIFDAHQGGFEFFVDWAAIEPETLDKVGRYIVRPDGRLELRDLWLGPDAAQCGHVIERWAVY